MSEERTSSNSIKRTSSNDSAALSGILLNLLESKQIRGTNIIAAPCRKDKRKMTGAVCQMPATTALPFLKEGDSLRSGQVVARKKRATGSLAGESMR